MTTIVDKQVNSVDNRSLILLTRQRLSKALGTMAVVATFLIATSAVPSFALAYDIGMNPENALPLSYGGYTFTHVIHWRNSPSDGVAVYFNDGTRTPSAYEASYGCPPPYGSEPDTTVGALGGLGTSECSAWSSSQPVVMAVLHGVSGGEIQFFHGCDSSWNCCTPEVWNPIEAIVHDFSGTNPVYPQFYTSVPVFSSWYSYPDICGALGACTIPDTSTHFITTTPLNNDTVSSTTPVTVGAHVYINDNDYESGMYLNIAFTNETVAALGGSALDAWNAAWGTGSTGGYPAVQIPLVIGDNDVSTTTSDFVRDGRVTAVYSVQSPSSWSSLWFIGGLFSGSTVISTTTQFIVGEKTSYDIASDQGGAGIANTILFGTTTQGISTTTVEQITSACLPYTGYFNLYGCLQGLIIPSQSTLQNLFQQAKDGFLSYFPFGYVSRFYAIVSGTATTTLPSLSVTVPAGFPASGDTINLTMWGHLMGTGSYLSIATSTVTGHTFYATFESYWEKFCYFVFGLGVVLRLLGMNSVVSFGLGSKEDKSKPKMQYKKK